MDWLIEAFEEPGFYILAGLGIVAEFIGFMVAKKMETGGFPIWQMILIMLVTVVASAYFSTKD